MEKKGVRILAAARLRWGGVKQASVVRHREKKNDAIGRTHENVFVGAARHAAPRSPPLERN